MLVKLSPMLGFLECDLVVQPQDGEAEEMNDVIRAEHAVSIDVKALNYLTHPPF